jgi:hypothetical protein
MTQPSHRHTDAANRRAPFPHLAEVVAHLDDASEDRFYTGFSGEIASGGLFAATYDLKEIGTPVEVELRFSNGGITFARGAVEWIREPCPRSPDLSPGMGIALRGLTPLAVRAIEEHIAVREPLFWDGATDDIAQVQDTNGETGFAAGMLRDVGALLASCPTQLAVPPVAAPKPAAEPRRATELSAAVSRQARVGQFNGGFTDSDGPFRAFVATRATLPVGAPVRLHIQAPDGISVAAEGEVRWLRRANPLAPSHASPPGLGVRLCGVPPAVWRALGGTEAGVLSCEGIADA